MRHIWHVYCLLKWWYLTNTGKLIVVTRLKWLQLLLVAANICFLILRDEVYAYKTFIAMLIIPSYKD